MPKVATENLGFRVTDTQLFRPSQLQVSVGTIGCPDRPYTVSDRNIHSKMLNTRSAVGTA
jgi:hypothetical protein